MRLSNLVSRNVAIWGAGRDGRAAAEHLLANGCTVTLVCDEPATDELARTVAFDLDLRLEGVDALSRMKIDFLVRSPGVSRYRQEVTDLSDRGIESSNLLALWLADQDPNRIIGVTGTKGKSTTASLIAELLRAAGVTTVFAGNIGSPVTTVDKVADAVVLEVSSYQASDCSSSPSIGVLTGLGQDHLTWHGSLSRYHHDKVNLFAHAQLRHMVFHHDDEMVRGALTNTGADSKWFTSGRRIGDIVELVGPTGVLDRLGVTTFPRNLLLAIEAVTAHLGTLSDEHIRAAMTTFSPLSSRQESIGVIDGVTYVDDALASNPMATITAVERFDDAAMVLIIGGLDRGVDYSDFIEVVNRSAHVTHVVIMGSDDDPLATRIAPFIHRAVRSPSQDVDAAVRSARQLVQDGGRIVFSPAAPTPPEHGDYTDRSRMFRDAMNRPSSLS